MWKNNLFTLLLGFTGITLLVLTISARILSVESLTLPPDSIVTIKETRVLNEVLSPEEAAKQINKIVKVKGKVVTVYYAKDQKDHPIFLNLNQKFPNNPMAIVIQNEDKDAFYNISRYEGREIIVEGKMTLWDYEYGQKPVIIISKPEQIQIL